jgi:hypothetical protein
MRLTASLPTLTRLGASVTEGYLSHRDPGELHLKYCFFHVSCHSLVAFEDLGDELALALSWDLQALDLAGGRKQVTLVVTVAFSSPGGVSSR